MLRGRAVALTGGMSGAGALRAAKKASPSTAHPPLPLRLLSPVGLSYCSQFGMGAWGGVGNDMNNLSFCVPVDSYGLC